MNCMRTLARFPQSALNLLKSAAVRTSGGMGNTLALGTAFMSVRTKRGVR